MSLRQIIVDHYGPATAGAYDQLAERFFWGYSESLSALSAEVLYGRRRSPDEAVDLRAVLDLGAGTGNLARQLVRDREASRVFLDAAPPAAPDNSASKVDLCLFDAAPAMLEVARSKLSDHPLVGRLDTVIGEMTCVESLLSGRRFDCIVSSYAIHHLSGEDKRRLFAVLHGLLNPGGVLAIADRIQDSVAENLNVMCSRFSAFFMESGKRERLSRVLEDARRQFEEDHDQPSTQDEQVQWMREAGFTEVRVPWHSFGSAVISGRRRNH